MSGPKAGDYVIVKISHIVPYGAFCELVEYPGYRGFIHISEVSTAWVKNIRQHVKEGQMRVAKVLRVSHDKKMCDLSLKRVSGAIERRKMEEVRRRKRAKGLMAVLEKQVGEKVPEGLEKELAEHFGDVLRAFEEAALRGEDALADVPIPEKWKRAIVSVAKKYIEIPRKTVRARLEIVVPGPNGVDVIKNTLMSARKLAEKEAHTDANIYTQGAPTYIVEITSHDYKTANRVLKDVCEYVVDAIRRAGGEASFEVVEE